MAESARTILAGLGAAQAEADQRRRADYLLVGATAIAWVLFQFRAAIEKQLEKLHPPTGKGYGFDALHDETVGKALAAWRGGKVELDRFQPLGHRELIYQHAVVSTVMAIVVTATLVQLVRRHVPRPRWSYAAMVVQALSWAATILVDLSVAQTGPGARVSPIYAHLFPALDWVRWGAQVMVAVAVVPAVVGELGRSGWRTYRGSAASARIALWVGLGFFAVCSLGDIGAQLDDLVRRELATGSGGAPVVNLAVLVGAVTVLVASLRALNTFPLAVGKADSSWWLVGAGAAATGLGAIVVWRGGQSTAVVGGVMLLLLGALSVRWEIRPELSRRTQLGARLGLVLVITGAALGVVGKWFGTDPHRALVIAGAIAAGCGASALLLGRPPRRLRPLPPGWPSGAEGAGLLVLLGVGISVGLPEPAAAGWTGLGISVLGLLLLLIARQEFRVWSRAGDVASLAAAIAGVATAQWVATRWWTPLAVLGVGGLLLNRKDHVALIQAPPEPLEELVPVPARAAPSDDDADPTWVLVAASALPITGLLVVSVRALSSVLATGNEPPLILVAFQVLLLVGAVGGGWWIARGQRDVLGPPSAPGWIARSWLVLLALATPVAAASTFRFRDLSQDLGAALGPLAVLVLLLAAVAATGGTLRWLTGSLAPPAAMRRLGLRRAPVGGLLVSWLLLVMVVGAPLEPDRATPHQVRPLEVDAASTRPQPCEDAAVRDAIAAGAATREVTPDAAVAEELCRWVSRLVGHPDIPLHQPLPLVLVSASGGGVRAASWTTRVLGCLLFPGYLQTTDDSVTGSEDSPGRSPCPGPDDRAAGSDDSRPGVQLPWSYVFAIGGASGGSVGAATAVAEQIAPFREDAAPRGKAISDWARDVAERDHLGPVAGQMAIAELGLAAAGIVPEHDRAETLIDEWSEPFGVTASSSCPSLAGTPLRQVGFLQAYARCPGRVPLLLFNGTVVRAGSRFDVSPLSEPGGSALGLRDTLCTSADGKRAQDVPLFDAAFLSARFPLVTPSGRLGQDLPTWCSADAVVATDVVDGGYHENSGTAQLRELWSDLAPLVAGFNDVRGTAFPEIRPIVLQIVNGKVDPKKAHLDCPTVRKTDPSVSTSPDRDLAVAFGEPLRIPWAIYQARVRASDGQSEDDFSAMRFTEETCLDEALQVPLVTLALYDYPGRSLPLGWSLTGGVLDDIESILKLRPNACRAEAFIEFVDAGGHADIPDAKSCEDPNPLPTDPPAGDCDCDRPEREHGVSR